MIINGTGRVGRGHIPFMRQQFSVSPQSGLHNQKQKLEDANIDPGTDFF